MQFHIDNFARVLPIIPICFVPVVTDALHTILLESYRKHGDIDPLGSVRQVWKHVPSLFEMKIFHEGAAFLWSFVPVYGIIKGINHRISWAMASNVLIIEGKSGAEGRWRCEQLCDSEIKNISIRALVIIPALAHLGL